jgi:hypothetical protein
MGAGTVPYVTGAVAQGSQAGGGQAGAHVATGCGLGQHQLQQPHPPLVEIVNAATIRKEILFIVPYPPGKVRRLNYGEERSKVRNRGGCSRC